MNFPKWAPEDLCDLYRKHEAAPEDHPLTSSMSAWLDKKMTKALLERLLTKPEMEAVWDAWREAPDPEKYPNSFLWDEILIDLAHSDKLPTRNQTMKVVKDVKHYAEKLKKAIEEEFSLLGMTCAILPPMFECNNPEDDFNRPHFGLMIDEGENLRSFHERTYKRVLAVLNLIESNAKGALETVADPTWDTGGDYSIAHPNHGKPHVRYFIKRANMRFQFVLGKTSPKLVTNLAYIVFEDTDVTEDYVGKILNRAA